MFAAIQFRVSPVYLLCTTPPNTQTHIHVRTYTYMYEYLFIYGVY
jgi:hypothetical protein